MKRLNVRFDNRDINMSLPAAGVLSAILTVTDRTDQEPEGEDKIKLSLSGLDATDSRHPRWGNFKLSVGETVTITIHGDRISDVPIRKEGPAEEEIALLQREYVRKMAAEWGWTITEKDG